MQKRLRSMLAAVAMTLLAPLAAHAQDAETRDNAAMTKLLAGFDVKVNGWTKGPTLDAIINIYERTRDPKYRTLLNDSLKYGRGWRSGDSRKIYYDDSGWYANAWLRAYDVTGDPAFLIEAKAIFSDMTKVWDNTCGGGIWWTSEKTYKNAITNELFMLAAARLARRSPNGTGPGSYQDWALKETDWFLNKSGMINGQKLVNDGLTTSTCKNNNQATWSYNQGVILGGLTEMWRLTGDRGYLFNAEQIAEAVFANMTYSNGTLRDVCDENSGGCSGDAVIFKGMFAQGLARLYNADRNNKPKYGSFLNTNADSIWNRSRNAQNGLGVKWNGPVGTPSQSSQAAGSLLLSEVALLKVGGETSTPPVVQVTPIAGPHVIVNALTGIVIDNGNTANPGAGTILWAGHGGSQQRWQFTQNSDNSWTLTNEFSGLVLDNPGYATANGVQPGQWASNGGDNQRWWVDKQDDGSYKIWNKASSHALDGTSISTNGKPLIQWEWNGQTQQRWYLQ